MNKNGSSNTTLASPPVILPLGFLRSRGGGPDLSGFGSKTSALYGDSRTESGMTAKNGDIYVELALF